MDSTPSSNQTAKIMYWVGWVVTLAPVAMLLMSAFMKLSRNEELITEWGKSGFPENTLIPIGVAELASTILFVIPQTAVLGAILLTGYLGGAICTHVRGGQAIWAPLAFGVLVWVALFLRDSRIRALIPLRRSAPLA